MTPSEQPRHSRKTFLIFLAVPLSAGLAAGLIAGNSAAGYQSLTLPPLSPPGWVFPVVWTILYLLMGIASYLVFLLCKEKQESAIPALFLYILQLLINFFWPIFFFRLEWYLFSFFWLVLLWMLVLHTTQLFGSISKTAGYLMLPYLAWVTFAAYLNLGVVILN